MYLVYVSCICLNLYQQSVKCDCSLLCVNYIAIPLYYIVLLPVGLSSLTAMSTPTRTIYSMGIDVYNTMVGHIQVHHQTNCTLPGCALQL